MPTDDELKQAVAAERQRCAMIAEESWINSTSPWAERNGAAKLDAHNAACAQIARSIRYVPEATSTSSERK